MISMEVSNRWDVRPYESGWSYSIVNAGDNPTTAISYTPWPYDEDAQQVFITLPDDAVMYLQHTNGRLATHTHKALTFWVEWESLPKGNRMLHKLRVSAPFLVHRWRMWVVNSSGQKYFLGEIAKGETVTTYLTHSMDEYHLEMDDVCKALFNYK